MIDTFFSYFSGLKPDLTKSKIAGVEVLKGFQVAICDIRYIDLNNDTLNFFKTVIDIQRVLKIYGNEKPYTRRKNRYFENNSNIKNCFPITEGFYLEKLYP